MLGPRSPTVIDYIEKNAPRGTAPARVNLTQARRQDKPRGRSAKLNARSRFCINTGSESDRDASHRGIITTRAARLHEREACVLARATNRARRKGRVLRHALVIHTHRFALVGGYGRMR